MDSEDIRQIQLMISRGFPAPPATPPLQGETTREQRQAHHDAEAATFFDRLAHRAVNSNQKRDRDWMRSYATDFLLHGKPLPIAMRAWLLYVLGNVEDMPHAAMDDPGRPPDDYQRLCDLNHLANFLAKRHNGKCPSKLTSIDKDAAVHELCMSASAVRKLFDCEDFKTLVANLY